MSTPVSMLRSCPASVKFAEVTKAWASSTRITLETGLPLAEIGLVRHQEAREVPARGRLGQGFAREGFVIRVGADQVQAECANQLCGFSWCSRCSSIVLRLPRMSVLFTADALRQFKKLPKAARSFVQEAIRKQLLEEDPREPTRNRFRLRRPSEHADYELRAGTWRIFYRVEPTRVIVTLLGEKRGEKLFVEGREVEL